MSYLYSQKQSPMYIDGSQSIHGKETQARRYWLGLRTEGRLDGCFLFLVNGFPSNIRIRQKFDRRAGRTYGDTLLMDIVIHTSVYNYIFLAEECLCVLHIYSALGTGSWGSSSETFQHGFIMTFSSMSYK